MKLAIFIDIEGFSPLYKKDPVKVKELLFRDLTYDLYTIGRELFYGDSDRLFIYHYGDGFLITTREEFDSKGPISILKKTIAIAIALMRLIILKNGAAKAAISYGEMEDTLGYCHEKIQDKISNGGCIKIGSGLMCIMPVMGDALINAHNLAKSDEPKGPLLLLDSSILQFQTQDINILESQLGDLGVFIINSPRKYIEIDWIHSEVALANEILNCIDMAPTSETLEEKLKDYIKIYDEDLPKEWKKNAELLIKGKGHRL